MSEANEIHSREFPCSLNSVAESEAWVSGLSSELALPPKTEFAINLCVEEIFVNAVTHGGATSAEISLSAADDGVRVAFADDGAPFDPTEGPEKRIQGRSADFEIGGYGLGLLKKFARRISYARIDARNKIELEFDLQHA